jgi:hypothetical protein
MRLKPSGQGVTRPGDGGAKGEGRPRPPRARSPDRGRASLFRAPCWFGGRRFGLFPAVVARVRAVYEVFARHRVRTRYCRASFGCPGRASVQTDDFSRRWPGGAPGLWPLSAGLLRALTGTSGNRCGLREHRAVFFGAGGGSTCGFPFSAVFGGVEGKHGTRRRSERPGSPSARPCSALVAAGRRVRKR